MRNFREEIVFYENEKIYQAKNAHIIDFVLPITGK
ncbi:MAG: hypothetical protein ACI81G_001485 [Gammaproteobacteria bacterium]|jgi:hypothetical protein